MAKVKYQDMKQMEQDETVMYKRNGQWYCAKAGVPVKGNCTEHQCWSCGWNPEVAHKRLAEIQWELEDNEMRKRLQQMFSMGGVL